MIQIDNYAMVIRALKDPDQVPIDLRLKKVLKSLLRNHKFRVISIKPVEVKAKTKSKRRKEKGS